jgi:hypothetical protein
MGHSDPRASFRVQAHRKEHSRLGVNICGDNDYDNPHTALLDFVRYLHLTGCGTICDEPQGSTSIRRLDIAIHRAEGLGF